ncbi:hypothetical protein BKA56DRAFT_678340 [Ilyonectria sp. MPI-CAGE-AT-0026]|nr:hypothetical protein BKA56DRAFT_678340 [Ilyonectria sp. MPI-CAGE-AT-0026]
MSHQQACSWKLLTEWLAGAYLPKHLAEAARKAIFSAKPVQDPRFPERPDFPPCALLDESVYHSHLSMLYYIEFMDYVDEDDPPYYLKYVFENLVFHRRKAASHATSQYIAHFTYHAITNSSLRAQAPARADTAHYASPIMQVCPWITMSTDLSTKKPGNPYYLWSIPQNKTVELKALPDSKPRYTCISHTWGRWLDADKVAVQGVPWLIPTNKIFEVRKIPEILSTYKSKIPTDYVWLDLICIPQTREGELGKRAKREISCQADIFTGSSHCLAWLNYIDIWAAEESSVWWLSFQYLYLSTAPGLYKVEEYLAALWAGCNDNPLRLTRHPDHRKYLGQDAFPVRMSAAPASNDSLWRRLTRRSPMVAPDKPRSEDFSEPSPWFSSLWTLQECCFCPHMTLMSRSFEPLLDLSGLPLTLERLISLTTETTALMKPRDQSDPMFDSLFRGRQLHLVPKDRYNAYPMGVSLLTNLMVDTQLRTSSSITRTSILAQGNMRHCSSRRAEAIMSVVDIRDWFQPDASRSQSDETDLVLGVYPLAFVREAARKLGPEFVMARKLDGSPTHSNGYVRGPLRGSMLPFDSIHPVTKRVTRDIKMHVFQAIDVQWNKAFSWWEFTPEGSVVMQRAAVLGERLSGGAAVHVPVVVNISWQEQAGERGMRDEILVPLQQWLQERPSRFWTFAVNVSRQLGIVLQGLRIPLVGDSVPCQLVKIGCYEIIENEDLPDCDNWVETQDNDWVPMREVNWIAL